MLQASRHQGHQKYSGNGRQCMANALAAIRESYKSRPADWNTSTLDTIMETGDTLYQCISSQTPSSTSYLMISDLPKQIDNYYLLLESSEPYSGSIKRKQTDFPFYSLDLALNKLCRKENSRCIFTMGSSSPSYSSAILHIDKVFCFFDPHSRNESGMACSDGRATMTLHKNIEELCLFIKHLCASLHTNDKSADPPFELVAVSMIRVDEDQDDEYSGFSDMSEGEMTCKLFLAQEVNTDMSDISPVSSPCMSPISYHDESDDTIEPYENDIEHVTDFKDNVSVDFVQNENGYEADNDDDDMKMNNDKVHVQGDGENENVVSFDDEYDGNDDVANEREKICSPVDDIENVKANSFDYDNDINDDIGGYFADCNHDVWLGANYDTNETTEGITYEEGKTADDTIYYWVEVNEGYDGEGANVSIENNFSENGFDNANSNFGVFDLDQNENTNAENASKPESVSTNASESDEDGDIPLSRLQKAYRAKHMYSNTAQSDLPMHEHNYSNITGTNPNMDCRDETENFTESITPGNPLDGSVSPLSDKTNFTNLQVRSRKRVRDEGSWKRNIIKRKKNSGQSYISHSGKEKRARILKKGCGQNCRKQCHKHITHEQREKVFHEFWGTGDVNRQRDFLSSTIKQTGKKRIINKRGTDSRRKYSRKYYLNVNKENIQVCSKFYFDTLDITFSQTETALNKSKRFTSGVSGKDNRGKHSNRPNKISFESINIVKDHIKSFPRIESHYCRKQSKKEYLSEDLSLAKMFSLYIEKCKQQGIKKPVTISKYRTIFNTCFNIGFHKPLKDQCDICTQYKNLSDTEKLKNKESYERHILNKDLARAAKEEDKALAKVSNSHLTACFDLQQVLSLPHAKSSSLYYTRKLNNFNLTVYSLGTGKGYSYLWNECVAQRGSCEIASCVMKFLETASLGGIKSATLYSDNCSGQNRNRFFLCMLWYALHTFSFEKIEHKFLERGHTQNENDSMHSCIETASRNISIYTTPQWATTIASARRSKPFEVTEMSENDFFDFKELSKRVRNLETTSDGEKVKWTQIHCLSLESSCPNTVEISYDYKGVPSYLNLMPAIRRKYKLPKLTLLHESNEKPVLSKEKYIDLQSLCEKNIIPKAYHGFYQSLPHKK